MQIAKLIASLGAVSLAAMASCGSSFAVDSTNFTFAMVSASSGVEGCLAKAAGRVTIDAPRSRVRGTCQLLTSSLLTVATTEMR